MVLNLESSQDTTEIHLYLAFLIEFLMYQKLVNLQPIFQGNIQVLQQRSPHLRTGQALDSSRL